MSKEDFVHSHIPLHLRMVENAAPLPWRMGVKATKRRVTLDTWTSDQLAAPTDWTLHARSNLARTIRVGDRITWWPFKAFLVVMFVW